MNALSLSLKAGAMARTGKRKESVYAFSKLFAQTDVKKISNYMSFRFILNAKEDPQNYLALCQNSEERANMLAMMALGDPGDKQAVMREIFRLAPQSPMLELLPCGRSINGRISIIRQSCLHKKADLNLIPVG